MHVHVAHVSVWACMQVPSDPHSTDTPGPQFPFSLPLSWLLASHLLGNCSSPGAFTNPAWLCNPTRHGRLQLWPCSVSAGHRTPFPHPALSGGQGRSRPRGVS